MKHRSETQTNDRPAKIGRYPVQGELGRGGMGIVYLARDPTLDRPIAIKMLPPSVAANEQRARRFVHEAKVLASLNHPNIATIHSLEEADGRLFITLEVIEGDTLGERLAAGALPADEAFSLGSQVARALEAAHDRGIVHRDLKPANVKITPSGLAKVLDFGLAKVLAEKELGDQTRSAARTTRELVGTPGYMSPEQVRGQPVDQRTDIWAFGCILYECLAGLPAFVGRNLYECMDRTTRREPDWNALPRDVPPVIFTQLRRCLAKDPAARPESIVPVRRQLDEHVALDAGPIAWRAEVSGDGESEPRGNLPVQLTAFVGRKAPLREVSELLGTHRLVTMTGPAGCGKSRLSIETSRRLSSRFTDGVWLVELASRSGPGAVWKAVASLFDLKERQGKTVKETILDALAHSNLLLLIDNCEHLLDACCVVAEEALRAAPGLSILATSREALGAEGEHVYPVPSMRIPESTQSTPHELMRVEAVELFVDRATAALHGFTLTPERCAAIAEICRRLDGIPLAIEIAAASVRVLPVEELAARLDHSLELLTRGIRTSLPRHRTLRAAIDWSHELLTEPERSLYRRLSIFPGGWTLDAAEEVCCGAPIEGWQILDLLTRLVEKSLVELDFAASERSGRGRYRMLGSIREYGIERAKVAGEWAALRERHLDYYCALAERAASHVADVEQQTWLQQLDHDYSNLRAAMEAWWTNSATDDRGLRLAAALGWYWDVRGDWSGGRAFCDTALERAGAADAQMRAETLQWSGHFGRLIGDYVHARLRLQASLEIRRRTKDDAGIAAALHNLGNVALKELDFVQARTLMEESLAIRRRIDDRAGIAASLNNLGTLAWEQGDVDTAGDRFRDSLELRAELQDHRGAAIAHSNLANIDLFRLRYDDALVHLQEAEEIYRALGDDTGLANVLHTRGTVAFRQGEYDAAQGTFEECLRIRRQQNDRRGVALAAQSLGNAYHIQKQLEAASLLYEECVELWRRGREPHRLSLALVNLGELTMDRGDLDGARPHLTEGLALAHTSSAPARCSSALRSFANLEARSGACDKAAILLAASDAEYERRGESPAPEEVRERDRLVTEIRAKIGDAAFERAREKGRSFSLEEAIQLASG